MGRAIFISLVGAAISSCLLTPIVFEYLRSNFELMPWPYSRVFDRVFAVLLLLFIIYFHRDFDSTSIKRALRYPSNWAARIMLLLSGLVISSLAVGLCMIGIFEGGILVVNERTPSEIAHSIFSTLPIALVISVVEESFFRVLLFKRLFDFCSRYFAAVTSSLLYALVHFISPQKSFVYRGESWFEGFEYVPLMFTRLLEPGTALGIAGLFTIGLILCYAIVRIGSVYISIGLHMGWIVAARTVSFLSLRHPDVDIPKGLGGRYFLFSEGWAWISFVLVALAIVFFPRRYLFREESKVGIS